MIFANKIEIILITALLVVASDQGNFLLRKSLISPFPAPKTKEYMEDMAMVSIKFSRFFSSVKTKKKNMDVASETQHRVIKFLRFIIGFPASKLGCLKVLKIIFAERLFSLQSHQKPSPKRRLMKIISRHRLKNILLRLFPSSGPKRF